MHVQRLLTWQSLKHGDEGYSIAVLLRRGLSSIRSFWCAFETCRGRGSTPNSIQKQSTEQKARLSQLGPGHCRPNRGQRLLRRSSSRPVPLAGPTFLACLRKMVVIRMLMRTMMMGAFRHISDRVGGGGVGGLGGDDDDIVTQTPRTISPEEPFCSVFTVLSCCRTILHIQSPNLLLDFATSTLGFRRVFCENSNLGGGTLVSGKMTTLFCGRPEQYARTHHTLLQKHTLLRRGLGFRGVGEPLPRTAGCVFDVYRMLCFRC